MKNKYYKILVNKLQDEIEKFGLKKNEWQQEGTTEGLNRANIARDYINYHREIIRFIKRVDKEVD